MRGGVKKIFSGHKTVAFASNSMLEFQKKGFRTFKGYENPYYFTCFIYNRNFIKEQGIYFPDYIWNEDPVFLIRAMIAAKEFYAIDEIVYYYRLEMEKYVQPSEKNLYDYFSSAVEQLKISQEYHLEKLKCYIISDIYRDYMKDIYHFLWEGSVRWKTLAEAYNSSLDDNDPNEDKYRFLTGDAQEMEIFRSRIRDQEKSFLDFVKKSRNIVIYGAGTISMYLVRYLKEHGMEGLIKIAVSKSENNKTEICGIKVSEISCVSDKDITIIIAVLDTRVQEEIENSLKTCGFRNIHRLDYDKFRWFGL